MGTGAAGLYMSFFSFGGAITHAGFGLLALSVLTTTVIAYAQIRRRNVAVHREWMLRSCGYAAHRTPTPDHCFQRLRSSLCDRLLALLGTESRHRRGLRAHVALREPFSSQRIAARLTLLRGGAAS
jgi:hypothetical protein